MKNQFLIRVGIGVAVLLMGIVLQILDVVSTVAGISLVNAGLIIIVFSLIYHFRNKNRVYQDERTRKLGYRSLGYSWTGTFILIGVLSWMTSFDLITVTGQQAFSLVMAFMAITYFLYYAYVTRKGDVE